ncbi:pyridoxamine 5'-phosphate oxidase family protein [Microcoleus sp. Pol11C3]|uniref:pyridoxamine 5'-phosphate oxidase family protein n=1 Tax=Microcoleus sp. Pol11C3 TaxID=3055390 RepID=UPI002FD009E0
MLDIDEMGQKEIHELLHKVGYGHLGCIHEGKPYVIPMNYYLEEEQIYLFK